MPSLALLAISHLPNHTFSDTLTKVISSAKGLFYLTRKWLAYRPAYFSHGHRRKAGREIQTELNTIMNGGRRRTLSGAGAGHRAVSLHRGCVLVFFLIFSDSKRACKRGPMCTVSLVCLPASPLF